MKQMIKFLGVLLTGAVVGATALKADDKPAATNAPAAGKNASSKGDDLFPDPVVAKGKGVEVKRSRLDEAITGIQASAKAHGQTIPAADIPLLEKNALDRLLQLQLLNGKATDADKATGKAEGDKRMETLRKNAPSEEMLARQLKSINLTIDELHSRLIEETTAEAVLRDKVSVSDAEIKGYFESNTARFEEPEKVHVAHILISTGNPRSGQTMSDDDKKAKRKIADDLLKRAKAGEDFGKLAKEYSDDPGSKDKGGEYPPFPRGTMVGEFEAAAFSMQTNQISDVVTTVYGYHIIKLLEKYPAKKHDLTEPEIKDMIKAGLEAQKMALILPDYYVQLKKEANVEILDQQLKALEDATVDAPNLPGTPAPPKIAPK